jgi:hypothetical protein
MDAFVGFNTCAMQLLQPAMQLEVAEIASVLGSEHTFESSSALQA